MPGTEKEMKGKPKIGFYSFTCCEGCGFTVLFLDELSQILKKYDVMHFNLIKERNKNVRLDIAFVEGAICSHTEANELKQIRKHSKLLVSMGACACHGGIPAMRNFLSNEEINKYVYNQKLLSDSIEASPLSDFIKVDYEMYGCPILKKEFMQFLADFEAGKKKEQYLGPVCNECPRRGINCYLREKKVCLGAVTNGGCEAYCIHENIPCIMCRGPLKNANLPAEINLFKAWGLSEREIMPKLTEFGKKKEAQILKKPIQTT